MRNALVIGSVALLVLAAGCARKPTAMDTSAPAPGGTAASRAGGGADQIRPASRPGTAASQPQTAGRVQSGSGRTSGTDGSSGTAAGGSTGATGATASRDGQGAQRGGSAARPALGEFKAIAELADIQFEFDKAEIRPTDVKVLQANAEWLRRNPESLLLIEGHCDERGTNEYNLALGERRAKAAMDYLVAQGIAVARITVVSYGEERPACSDHAEGCWTKNRRAHFLAKRG